MTDATRLRSTLLLLAVVGIAWSPALRGDFQYDDIANIVLDPATAGGAALLDRLANGFRPLLRLSYALDHRLWGLEPAGFIATNFVLHGLATLGIAALARRRFPANETAALAAALVFALQPAHAAVVASASGRSTGLASLLMIAALLAHDRGVAGSARARAAALVAMTLAFLAKETAIAFPLLLVLWERCRAEPTAWRVTIARVSPAAVLALAGLGAALLLSTRLREILAFSFAYATPIDALATHAAALPLSLAQWFRPWALSIEHPVVFAPVQEWAGAAAIAGMVVLPLAVGRRQPLVMLALLWPLVALLPTHSVVARLDPIVEKALYPAWIGPSLAIGAALASLRGRNVLPLRPFAGAGLAALVALSAWRAGVWADPVLLWREASLRAPASARVWSNLALVELEAGREALAARAVARALELDPRAEAAHEVARAVALSTSVPTPVARETTP